MSGPENPNATPQVDSPVNDSDASHLPAELAEQLARSRPWVVVLAIGSLAYGLLTLVTLRAFVPRDGQLDPSMVIFGLIVMSLAVAATLSGLFLLRYANQIAQFARLRTTSNLEKVLAAQCRVWQVPAITAALFVGVMMLMFVLRAFAIVKF